MKPEERIVTHTPMNELWNGLGALAAKRGRELAMEDVRELVHQGEVRFVIADPGRALVWVDSGESYNFWKAELRERILHPSGQGWQVGRFLDGYAYRASEWLEEGAPIVLLERMH
jgi:hypothetical protein